MTGKTTSGYQVTIRAFLPCTNSAAAHASAALSIEGFGKSLENVGCVEIAIADKWKPRRKSKEEDVE